MQPLSFEDIELWQRFHVVLIINHSLCLNLVLYTWCEIHLAKTFALDYLLA
jgi:hypothetical protein